MDFEEKSYRNENLAIDLLLTFWKFKETAEKMGKKSQKNKKKTGFVFNKGKNGEKGNTIDRKARKLDLLKLRNINEFKQT